VIRDHSPGRRAHTSVVCRWLGLWDSEKDLQVWKTDNFPRCHGDKSMIWSGGTLESYQSLKVISHGDKHLGKLSVMGINPWYGRILSGIRVFF
jgi:hypothetical protein